jgi:transposase
MTMTTAASTRVRHDGRVDEKDPAARPRRGSFTAEYKAGILDEYDQLPSGSPERGALLRREGLYTSHIAEWRRQRDAAALEGLSPKVRRGRKTAEQVELEKLRRRNDKLEAELERTRLALEITGKAHALLELLPCLSGWRETPVVAVLRYRARLDHESDDHDYCRLDTRPP